MQTMLENLKRLDLQIFKSLSAHPNLQSLRDVEFFTTDEHIRIRGRVSTYFEKQIAQETIRSIDDQRSIENELNVDWMNA